MKLAVSPRLSTSSLQKSCPPFNLGRVMRKIVGAGAPKWLAAAFAAALAALWAAVANLVAAALGVGDAQQRRSWERPGSPWRGPNSEIGLSTSAC